MSANNLSLNDDVIEEIKTAVLNKLERTPLTMVADFTNTALRMIRHQDNWTGYGGLRCTYFQNLTSETSLILQNFMVRFEKKVKEGKKKVEEEKEEEEEDFVVPLLTLLLFLYTSTCTTYGSDAFANAIKCREN